MNRHLIRLGLTALVAAALVYACSKSTDSPTEPLLTRSAAVAQSECGENQFLTALSPVLAAWEDSIETWQGDGDILDSPPVFTDQTNTGEHLDALVDVLTQWETTLNNSLASAPLDTVQTFDPATANHQDYLAGLSALLASWKTALDTAHGTAFLPAPPVFARDTTAPVIDCPADTVITCAATSGVDIDFDIPVTDDCQSEPTVVIDGPDGNHFDVGETEVTVTASDSSGNESSCSFTVTVQAAPAPEITHLEAEPNVLWPPNHKWVTVRLDAELDNPCDMPVEWSVVEVTSNEAENGTGDGDTAPDWKRGSGRTVLLRAERSGSGSGREYTIRLRADGETGSDEATVRVFVPHDKGHK
ncbi:MAG TPA: HYR domain-containing protein [Candidatus Krumholzibacteria bacterium]